MSAKSEIELLPERVHENQLSELTGIQTRVLRKMAENGAFAEPVKSRYMFAETIQGLLEHFKTRNSEERLEKSVVDKQLVQANVELKRMDIAERQNELIPRSTIQPALERAIKEVAARIESVSEITQSNKDRILRSCEAIWLTVSAELQKQSEEKK